MVRKGRTARRARTARIAMIGKLGKSSKHRKPKTRKSRQLKNLLSMQKKQARAINIIILGFDSLSRQSVARTLKKTLKWLEVSLFKIMKADNGGKYFR